MKKRNLFLSLVSSIILTVALVVVTCVSVFATKPNNNSNGDSSTNVSDVGVTTPNYPSNEDRDGTEEKPYYIYDAESFIEMINDFGNENKYFELDRDIDFIGIDFVTLCQDKAFNGHINGKGFALKNIAINVTENNIKSFIHETKKEHYAAHVAVFGELDGAVIEDLTFDNLQITVDSSVYSFIENAGLGVTDEGVFDRLTVGGVAATAFDSTIDANVNATIDAGAYAVYQFTDSTQTKVKVLDTNAVGGVVGVADNTTITGTVNVNLVAVEGHNYYIGGVAGYAYDSTILTSEVVTTVAIKNHSQVLYVAGVAGYVSGTTIGDAENAVNVKLNLTQVENKINDYSIVDAVNDYKFTSVAGIVNTIRANDETQKTAIENVKVTSNVDADVIFAGALVEVRNASVESGKVPSERFVTIKDVIVDSTVNTLKAFGFARNLYVANVDLGATEVVNHTEYNVKLSGNINLKASDDSIVTSLFVNKLNSKNNGSYNTIVGGFKSIKVNVTNNIKNMIDKSEVDRAYMVTIAD